MVNNKPKKIFELFRASDGGIKIIEDAKAYREGTVRELGIFNYEVLKALVSFMDAKGTCYPSIETIANMLGISARTVMRALKELEGMGYIKKEQIKLPNVKAKHNQYTILTPVEDTTEDENSGSDVERLFAHFKNKFREKFNGDYKAEYGVESDLRHLEKIYKSCGYDFDYTCKVIDKHIATYKGQKGFELPNIYGLLNFRLVSMQKKAKESMKLEEKIKNPQKPRGKYVNFADDDDDDIVSVDTNEFNEFLSEQSKTKKEIANF